MTGCDCEQHKKMRLGQWFAVAAFSTIALVAMTSNRGKIKDETKEVKWAVSAVSISLTFSALAVFAHILLKAKFVNTAMEGRFAFLTCAFWAAVIPAIMDPGSKLAVTTYSGGIENNNLYFFTWAAFLTSFYLICGCIACYFGECKGSESSAGSAIMSWGGLLVTSLIVTMNAARQFNDLNCDNVRNDNNNTGFSKLVDDFEAYCDRVEFAVALGTVSAVIIIFWVIWKYFMDEMNMAKIVNTFMVWLLLLLWTIGISYITFDEGKGPGSRLGNLYFFTWGSWGILVFMAMPSLQNMISKATEETKEEIKEDVKNEPATGEEADVEPAMGEEADIEKDVVVEDKPETNT